MAILAHCSGRTEVPTDASEYPPDQPAAPYGPRQEGGNPRHVVAPWFAEYQAIKESMVQRTCLAWALASGSSNFTVHIVGIQNDHFMQSLIDCMHSRIAFW
ncbi:MAG: hypothetical protein KGJ62_08375 [Armatimonadetes bacterium]|nr:hypothetical protein [Armatimonadota bacterium]MDE2205093.1 hypothetical protein [Armatimonadota bacterium]